MTYFYVVLGGGLGAALRFWLGGLISAHTLGLPLSMLIVNVLGCSVAGFVVDVFKDNLDLKLFVLTGVLGGFTTFSAFSIETLKLIELKQYTLALLYIGLSVVLSVLGAIIGFKLAGMVSAA